MLGGGGGGGGALLGLTLRKQRLGLEVALGWRLGTWKGHVCNPTLPVGGNCWEGDPENLFSSDWIILKLSLLARSLFQSLACLLLVKKQK